MLCLYQIIKKGVEGDQATNAVMWTCVAFSIGAIFSSLAPDCSWLLSSPNIQSGKFNEMGPIMIGTAVSVISYTDFITLVPSPQIFVGRERAQ